MLLVPKANLEGLFGFVKNRFSMKVIMLLSNPKKESGLGVSPVSPLPLCKEINLYTFYSGLPINMYKLIFFLIRQFYNKHLKIGSWSHDLRNSLIQIKFYL